MAPPAQDDDEPRPNRTGTNDEESGVDLGALTRLRDSNIVNALVFFAKNPGKVIGGTILIMLVDAVLLGGTFIIDYILYLAGIPVEDSIETTFWGVIRFGDVFNCPDNRCDLFSLVDLPGYFAGLLGGLIFGVGRDAILVLSVFPTAMASVAQASGLGVFAPAVATLVWTAELVIVFGALGAIFRAVLIRFVPSLGIATGVAGLLSFDRLREFLGR